MRTEYEMEWTRRASRAADRVRELAHRVGLQAELAALPKRPLEDSTVAGMAFLMIAQVSICAIVAALYWALR